MSGHKVKEDSAVGLVKWVQGRAKAQTGTPPLGHSHRPGHNHTSAIPAMTAGRDQGSGITQRIQLGVIPVMF